MQLESLVTDKIVGCDEVTTVFLLVALIETVFYRTIFIMIYYAMYIYGGYPYTPGGDGAYNPNDVNKTPLSLIVREYADEKDWEKEKIIDLFSSENMKEILRNHYIFYSGIFDSFADAWNYHWGTSVPDLTDNSVWHIKEIPHIKMPDGTEGMFCDKCSQFNPWVEPNDGIKFICFGCRNVRL